MLITFFSAILGYFIVEKIGSLHLGFGVIGAAYLLLLFLVVFFGKKTVANKLVKVISAILLKMRGKGLCKKKSTLSYLAEQLYDRLMIPCLASISQPASMLFIAPPAFQVSAYK